MLTDITVGGPDRPPSKRMIEQMRREEQEERDANRPLRPSLTETQDPSGSQSQEGYWSYMQRQVQERTERLGLTSDSMDRVGENSSGLVDDVNKYIKNQKRKAVLGGMRLPSPRLLVAYRC